MADRGMTSGMNTAVQAAVIRPVLFYESAFAGVPIYLWTGVGSYVWDGKTWVGNGTMVSITPLRETVNIEAQGFAITITGLPSTQLLRALNDARESRNEAGKVWLGLFDASGALTADPYQLVGGRFSRPRISDAGEVATIVLEYESALALLERAEELRYTSEHQKFDFPSDKGFDQVPALQDISFNLWGT